VSDRLHLGDDLGPGPLVDGLVVEVGVGAGDLVGDAVVLADEQGVQAGQLDVLVGADVAGGEELVVGHPVGVGGHQEGAAGEVGGVVVGQQVVGGADHAVGAGAGLELAAGVGAEGGGGGGVGAVDLRAVQPGGDDVDLLARVAGPGAGVRVGQ